MNLRIPIFAAVLFYLLLPRQALAQEPTCPAFGLFSPSQTNNSITFVWNNGCGNGRLVLVAPMGAGYCPPMDGVTYGSNPDYGVAPPICGPWRAIYSGPSSNVVVTGLASNTAYDFMVFEYNDFGSIDYRVFDAPSSTFSTTGGGGGGPSMQAGLSVVSVSAGSVTLTILPGNGQATLVGAELGSTFTGFPANNFKYCVNNSYMSAGTLVGGSGNARAVGLHRHGLCGGGVQCSENPLTFTVTGLGPGLAWTFKAFEFEGCSSPSYNLNDGISSPITVNIPFFEPTAQATNLVFSSITTSSMTVNWTNGNGQNRILVASPGTPVSFIPADGTTYTANSNYTVGPDLGGGQKVLYAGPNSSVDVTGLIAGITYHFMVFEANPLGFGVFTNYLTTTALGNPASRPTLFAEPIVQATGLGSSSVASNSVTLNWTPGNGTSRMVIMDDGPLTFVPTDGLTYTANANYAIGTDLGSGIKCVYNGSGNSVAVSGLGVGLQYSFMVIEYNGSTLTTNYLYPGTIQPFGTMSPEPAGQGGNISFSNVNTNAMTVSWLNGSGNQRIVVARASSAVSFVPIDGVMYGPNSNFSTAIDQGSGNKVVYNGNGSFVDVTGLSADITYHFRVYEFNLGGPWNPPNYLTATATGNPSSRSTLAPNVTTQASNITFTSVQANSLSLNWTNGNGASRMVIMDDQVITFLPANSTVYTANANYSIGTDLGSGQKCVFDGTGNSVSITGLAANTTYYFRVFEYNGSALAINYNVTTAANNPNSRITLVTEPTIQASSIAFSPTSTNAITFNWTNGNGTGGRIIVGRQGSAVDTNPSDGTTYTASQSFGAGSQIGTGNFVVYSSPTPTPPITITNLAQGTTYYFQVYEYNGLGIQTNYLTTTAIGNPNNAVTLAVEPITQSTNLLFASVTTGSVTLNWTNGSGSTRLVLAKQGAAVDANPIDANDYAPSTTFGSGAQIGSGNYSVYLSNGNSVTVTGLLSGTTYHFRVFERDGSALTSNYLTATSSGNPASAGTLFAEPTLQASVITFSSPLTNGFTTSWTSGNGSSRVVIIDDAAISFTPTDGVTLTANPNYGAGTDLGSGQKCVFNGSGNSVAITGLAANTSYSIRIFEYNGTVAQTNYLTSTATGNPVTRKTLVAEPTAHAASFTATATSSSQNNLSFSAANTIANASGYMLLRRSDGTNPTATGVNDGQNPGSLSLAAGTTLVSVISNSATIAYNDNGLVSGIQYNYALIPYGFDGTNNETYNYRTAATLPVANATTFVVEPPAQPTAMVFSVVTPTSFTVSFTPPGTAPSGYLVVRKTGSSPSTAIPSDGSSYTQGSTLGDATIAYIGSSPSFNESSLTPATLYFYDVFAFNGTGGLSNYLTTGPLEGSQTTLANQPANQPTAINFTSVTASSLTLSFTASSGGADGYLVLRRVGASPTGSPSDGLIYLVGNFIGDGIVVSVGASLSVPESGLASNTNYHYSIVAYNGSGAATNYLTTAPPANSQLTYPPKPISLVSAAREQTSFSANWEAIAGITDFYIDVSSDNFSTYAPGYQNLLINGTTLSVTGLASGTNYKYRIRAGNATGQSVNSDEQSALTKPATPTSSGPAVVTQSGFTAAWDAVTGADNFYLDIASDNGFVSPLTGFSNQTLAGTTLTATVTGLPSGTTYYYRVRSSNQSGTSPSSLTVTVPTIPSAPVIDIPTDNRTSSSFLITWTAITGATNYFLDVYDITSTPVFVTGYQNKSVTGTFHNVTGLSSSTNYQAILRSANISGSSNDSNTKFTQTKDASGNDADPAPTVNLGSVASVTSVSASVANGTDPKTIVLFHRKITSTNPLTEKPPVEVASGNYVVNVASADIDEIGMEYYFEVTDFVGRKNTSPKGYVYRAIAGQALPNLSVGGRAENYRIFSIPLDYGGNNNIGDIFASVISQFQGYNKEKWRLVRYQGKKNVDYTEGLQRIEKAKGYWLNSIEAIDLQVSGGVIHANQDAPFILQLDDGWNQIGNPFTFDISWSDVRAKNPSVTSVGPLYVYNPAVKFDQNDNLRAWGGGFVYSDGASTIAIPVTVARATGRVKIEERVSANLGSDSWFVPLKVVQGNAVNDISGIGMDPSASNSKDVLDEMSLPRFVNYLELNGYHPEYKWSRFMKDVVTTAKSYTWNLKVESNFGGQETTLEWDQTDFGDNDAKLILFDVYAQLMIDMRLNTSYTFGSQSEKDLKVVYARSASDFVPGFSSIGQPYPNPFNNLVSLPVVVEGESSNVEFSVFDMMGRNVWTGMAVNLAGGMHQLKWNGHDMTASQLPDGVYIYRARINDGSVRQGRIIIKKN